MIDENSQELIHAAVDGELDATGRQRLAELLDASSDARRYHDELLRLSEFLNGIPDVDPPAHLQSQVFAALPNQGDSAPGPLSRFNQFPGFMRYGFAAAAGLLLAVAVYEGRNDLRDPGDITQMAGTISKGGPVAAGVVVDSLQLDQAGLKADVRLRRSGGIYLLEFRSGTEGNLDFEFDLSASGLQVEALVTPSQALNYASLDGEVRVKGTARSGQQVTILLQESGAGSAPEAAVIDVRFQYQGEMLQAGELALGS